jgi:hypothetical protein
MAETLTKSTKSQDAEKAQEKKRWLEPAPVSMKAVADESIPFLGLSGVSAMEPPIESHAAFLDDPRFSHSANNTQKAGLVTELQQAYGNQYVQHLVQSMKVQAKLAVTSPDDQYEREADGVAGAVTRASAPSIQRQAEEEEEEEPIQTKLTNDMQVQRQAEEPEEEEEEEEEPIQAKAVGSQATEVSKDLEAVINTARGSGQPLPDSVRSSLEPQLGHDFSQVHIHTDAKADKLSQQLGAKAFTTGHDVFFRDGVYQPGSDSGRGLIAHELTHVIQQDRSSEMVNRLPLLPFSGPGKLWETFDDQAKVILLHWMRGSGKELRLDSDAWGKYMMASKWLAFQLRNVIRNDARRRTRSGAWITRFHAEFEENGYTTGYGLLHGTNRNVGDFEIVGLANVTQDSWEKKVYYNLTFEWNDIQDPNKKYPGDIVLAALARALIGPLIRPKDYVIRIQWSAKPSVRFRIQYNKGGRREFAYAGAIGYPFGA